MVPSQNINHQFQRQQPGYYHQSSMYSQPTSYDNPPVNRIALHSHPGPIFGTLSCSYCGCRDLKAEGGWKVCAHCGTRVTENSPDYSLQQQSSSLEHPPPRPLPNHVMMRHSYSPPISPPFLADAHRFGSASNSNQLHSVCSNCNITATTLWRKAADGKTLCNPCGLFLKKNGTERKVAVVEDLPPLITKKSPISRVRKEKAGGGVDNWGQNISCSNCSTRETTLWRRNDEGLPICNACGLYKRLHGIDRPHDLKSEV
ncbi:hypothetical protein BDR26DRAFT_865698 [Obelidium mucronatum]|nr:hypothetical protein BDR26DRAFT_865698 [Obelidium mucronatum]